MSSNAETRGAGTCTQCGRAFAIRQTADGTVTPIGTATCSCGASSFRLLDGASVTESR